MRERSRGAHHIVIMHHKKKRETMIVNEARTGRIRGLRLANACVE